MKSLFAYMAGLLFLLAPAVMQGQQAESIITESSDPVEDVYIDDVVRRTMIFENRVLPYEPLREADIPWERRMWRIIDVRERINLPFVYPPQPFFTIIAEGAKSGEIKVFKDEEALLGL